MGWGQMGHFHTLYFTKCGPDGQPVFVIIQRWEKTVTYLNEDKTVYLGDPGDLTDCDTEVEIPEWLKYLKGPLPPQPLCVVTL